MSKLGKRLIESARQAKAWVEGQKIDGFVVHVPDSVDVRAIRRRTGLTQANFAARYGFSVASVRDWEQGRRTPERAARSFLKVIEREPEAVERALAS